MEISKKTPQDSSVGHAWKAVYISWTMDNSWFTQESLFGKADWCADSKLCSWKHSKKELNINLSNIFPLIDSSGTGLLLLITCELGIYSTLSVYVETYFD